MKDNTTLLTLRQAGVFVEEIQIDIYREKTPDFYNAIWFCAGQSADWTGFMDDYGSFIPVDWC